MFGIRRREFITLLGGPAATWPLAAGAQQAAKLPSIGALVIGNTNPEQFWRAFRQGLCDWGIMRGKTFDFSFDGRKDGPIGFPNWPPSWSVTIRGNGFAL